MTYQEWKNTFVAMVSSIVDQHKDLPVSELVAIFDYDNMRVQYPHFCPLYKTNTKCHNTDKLNCLFCACPYFSSSDNKPFGVTMSGDNIMSTCLINSRFASTYTYDHTVQCDCSACIVPHSNSFAVSHIANYMPPSAMEDACSLLEHIRGHQLSGIFGKYKVF